jgi:hypothetical protein
MATNVPQIQDYSVDKILHGVNGFGLQPTGVYYSVILEADTDTYVQAPLQVPMGGFGGRNRIVALMKYDLSFADAGGASGVWVAINSSTSTPAQRAAITSVPPTLNATNSELEPDCRIVAPGDYIHFISEVSNVAVSVAFYSILM